MPPSAEISPSTFWLRTDEPLFWLRGAGHETRWSPDYFYEARLRKDPHFVLQLTLAGEGFHRRGDLATPLPAGSAFLDEIPGDFSYGYPPHEQRPYELLYVAMVGSTARGWCRRLIEKHGNVLNFGRGSEVESLMLSIAHRQHAGTLGDRYQVSSLIYQLLMTAASSLMAAQLSASPRVRQALALIAEGSHAPAFNVTTLATRLECSREHLARQFMGATGVSPLEYLQRHRLRLVLRELRGSTDKLETIAHRCGFSSANYLCRLFRQQYGLTPAQARANPSLIASA